jgi:TRAP-type mannitol/chloroaromatic compound transport system permease small subunit
VRALLRVSRGIDAFTEFIGTIVYWLVPVVLAVGVWNVANRYVGQAIGQQLGSNVYIELQWYIFSVIFLTGAAYTLKHGEHVRVDLLYGSWSPMRKAWVNMLGTILCLIPFCILLIYFSIPAISNSWSIREMSPDPNGLPRYPIKTFILVSAVLLIIQGISEFIKNLAAITGHSDPTTLEENTLKETTL